MSLDREEEEENRPTPRDLPGLDALEDYPEPPKAVRGPSGHIFHSTSLGCLRPHMCLRSMAIHVVEHRWFEPFIALVITFNCVELAWESPLDPPGTWKAGFIHASELPLLFIFTFEMVAKILAYGLFMHKHAYLRDSWCCLDFVVVLMAWVPYVFPEAGNFTGIRAVRALRPLRTLQYVPGMPILVSAIIQACSQLGSAVSGAPHLPHASPLHGMCHHARAARPKQSCSRPAPPAPGPTHSVLPRLALAYPLPWPAARRLPFAPPDCASPRVDTPRACPSRARVPPVVPVLGSWPSSDS